jgi:hypothetical protein
MRIVTKTHKLQPKKVGVKKKKKPSAAIPEDAAPRKPAYSALNELIELPALEPSADEVREASATTGEREERRAGAHALVGSLSSVWFTFDRKSIVV